ncbi:MAG: hypothetical protein RIE08_05585 [Acidimicrobiales bacterium]
MTEPWASPDAAAGPGPTAGPVPMQPTRSDAKPRTGPDEEPAAFPIPLRPLSLADVLDTAFDLIRARPKTFAAIAIVFVVPGQLLIAWYSRDLLGGSTLVDLFEDPDSVDDSGGSTALVMVALLVDSIVLPFVAAAVAHVVVWWHDPGRCGAASALGATFRRSWPLFAGWFVAHVLQAAGILAVWVGVPVMMAFTAVVAPAIAVERIGPLKAVGRSFRLVSSRFFPTLWRVLAVATVATVLGWVLPVLPVAVGLFVGFDVGWIISAIAGIITSLLTTSFVAATAVVMYFDLRIRREGMDVEMRVAEVFAARPTP